MVASDLWEIVKLLPKDVTEVQIPNTDVKIDITAFPLDFLVSALQGEVALPGVTDLDSIIIKCNKRNYRS